MMDARERELFTKGIQHATATTSGAALDGALDELGWRDALAADAATTVATVFEHQGAAATTSSALGVVMARALGVELDGSTGVVLPLMGQLSAPVAGGELRGIGLATLPDQPRALIASEDGALVIPTSALELRTAEGMDPRLGLVEIAGSLDAAEPLPTTAPWCDARAVGQRALAHELVGASRTMLALAREHALDRVQFDRPIAGFQAVRHRLADSLVAIEGADAAAHGAWDDGAPLTAAMAKAIAGRSARLVARHAQQVLAGIGFTTEHSLHHYIRRALVLDHLLGDSRSLTASLGAELLAARRLPALLPL